MCRYLTGAKRQRDIAVSYDDARLAAIAAEECRILRRKEMLVRIAILIGAFLCGMVAVAVHSSFGW